jgi:hypothetical protein
MSSVGLVVNPGASRDVRRLTSLARAIDANEQVNTVARVLCGLAAGHVDTVLYMPEPSHVVERARDVLATMPSAARPTALRLLPVPVGDGYARTAAGTTDAAAALRRAGVACVITLGGDGTNRAVVAGWPDAVLVPLAGGTNNTFGSRVDPTAAGHAAGMYAADPKGQAEHLTTRPRLDIEIDGQVSIALVDLAVVRGGWVGAHAIWDPDLLVEAVVTRSDPAVPGLAGVAGSVHPLDEGGPRALHLRFGPSGRPVMAPLGPGQLVPVRITTWGPIEPGDTVVIPDRGNGVAGPVTLAFDGEREITLERGQRARATLVAGGPRILETATLLRRAARDGRLAVLSADAQPAGSAAPG